MIQGLTRTAALAALAAWWGGLTFYGGVVVPLGSARFGAAEQGVVTRDATQWLHAMALAAATGVAYTAWSNPPGRRRGPLLSAAILAVSTAVLVALHRELSGQLDPVTDAPLEPARFYQWHRAYLAVTTAQWLVGVASLRFLTATGSPPVQPPKPL